LVAVSPTALVALSAALLTAATGAGFDDCGCLREDTCLREFADFFDESRERAWVFFEPMERFDEALVLV
jgi:hypothetical protein